MMHRTTLALLAGLAACTEPRYQDGEAKGTEPSAKLQDASAESDAGRHKSEDAGKLDAGRAPDAGRAAEMGGAEAGQATAEAGPVCAQELLVVVRDFTEQHTDFERPIGVGFGTSLQIVKAELGADQKPVYASAGATPVTTGPEAFWQWYHDVPGVNVRSEVVLPLMAWPSGGYRYESSAFFPIDGRGFGNGPKNSLLGPPPDHNYLFTTEAHVRFTYRGGEHFTFIGDDDMWLYVNGKLAIDLGGLHASQAKTVNLDAEAARLGLQPGGRYALDIFHAERHTVESNYTIDTDIDLSCIENVRVD